MNGSRRLLYIAGCGLFVLGIVVVCFALFGSGSSGSVRSHVPGYTSVPTYVAVETPLTTPVVTAPPLPPLEGQAYAMVIDKIGVNAPVQTFGLDEQLVPIVPTGDNAADIVAWYDFSGQPGVNSNVVFGGHVTWFGPAVFYDLAALVAGDTIQLVGDDGAAVVYTVTDVYRVSETDPHAVEVMWPTPDPVITLITCVGDFIPSDDPVTGGDYTERLIVRGSLTSVTPGGGSRRITGQPV